MMLRIKEAIVVEGRYDKNTLAQMVDTIIVETSGFGVFKNSEKLALFRRLAAEIEQSYPSLLTARKLLRKILAPYAHAPFDAAVLGCTHYCLLAKDVRKTLTLPVTDGNGGVARRVRKLCGACSSPARVRLVTTSFANYRAVRAAAKDILGENVLLY